MTILGNPVPLPNDISHHFTSARRGSTPPNRTNALRRVATLCYTNAQHSDAYIAIPNLALPLPNVTIHNVAVAILDVA